MNKNKIIKQVKAIILKYCNPVRIYLYGSQADGTANSGSDIDIAYDDKNCKNHHLIIDEVQQIETLIKIDVKNIAHTDQRFYNRVITTGKVIYSATKKLRAEDALHNFSKALKKFIEVVDNEDFFRKEGLSDIYLDVLVKRFEFSYEMAWKALKHYLDFIGITATYPRMVFKEAYAQQIISNENVWLEMIEQRNLSSHIYDEFEISAILEKKNNFKNAFVDLQNYLSEKLNLPESN